MQEAKKKQLRLTAIFVVLICIFTGAGFWFRGNPLFSGQGLRLDARSDKPVETYAPYAPAFAAAEPAAAVPSELASAEPAAAMPRFFTTERAAVFTFSGLGNEQELQAVLGALKNTKSRATFFVTAEEMERFPEQIEEISRAGHHLGIGIKLGESVRADKLLKSMQTQAETLRSKYQAYYEIFVRPTFGSGSTALLQAAASGGFRVLTEMKEAVPEKVSRMTGAEEVLSVIFSDKEGMLQRGEIVHFQMGLFQRSDTILGDLIERIVAEKSTYPVLPADEVAGSTEKLYQYPVPEDQILPSVKDMVYPGHLSGMTQKEIFQLIRSRYIGIPWIVSHFFLPGFSDEQTHQLDRTGIIKNDQNYIFLTFDDWGTDGPVDRLLSVLEKHNATATFFVRSQYVPNNPNLLRAIAAAGHTIGAHTHTHMPLSNEVYPTSFEELDEQQRDALEKDIVLCYETLESVIGDMTDADGKPSLSLLFRQPTLAVGRNGLETVFDCGYTYAIAGSYSATDYKAESVESLVRELRKNFVPGAVLIMHFSDNAKYTADALDILLTEFENSGKGFRFVGLNKVL